MVSVSTTHVPHKPTSILRKSGNLAQHQLNLRTLTTPSMLEYRGNLPIFEIFFGTIGGICSSYFGGRLSCVCLDVLAISLYDFYIYISHILAELIHNIPDTILAFCLSHDTIWALYIPGIINMYCLYYLISPYARFDVNE